MLSEREQRAIKEIERQISEEDPRFVVSMRRLLSGRFDRRHVLGYDVIIVVAALSAVLCFALSAAGAGLVAILLAVAVWSLRPRCRPFQVGWRRLRRQVTDG